ncbi:hypothetical protein COP1_036958 [Malus domestica]
MQPKKYKKARKFVESHHLSSEISQDSFSVTSQSTFWQRIQCNSSEVVETRILEHLESIKGEKIVYGSCRLIHKWHSTAPTTMRLVILFNELEFEEYDPTPYGGGFDIVQTYGKPLSPSLETCYPRSSGPAALNPPSLEGVTDGSIVPLSGKQEPSQQAPKPINGSQPMQAVEEEKQHQERREDQPSQVEESPNQVEESEEVVQGSYEHGQEVYNQVPSGYGLEAMDICESLFGYWPCLARDFKRGNGNGDSCYEFGSGEGRYGNPWKGTADYLFGSSNPYGEIRDGGSNYLQ